jgi:hypothetical protein
VNKAFERYEKQLKAAKSSGKNTKANQEKILAAAQRSQAKRGGKGKNEPIDDAGAWGVCVGVEGQFIRTTKAGIQDRKMGCLGGGKAGMRSHARRSWYRSASA